MPVEPKRIALRLALAVVCVAFVLALGEGVASQIGGRSSFRGLHAVRDGAPWLYDLVPNTAVHGGDGVSYRTNANGFRDFARVVRKPAGVFRIAVLGDSVAFGYGADMEDGFVARTEAALGSFQDDREDIEVLNFAVSGYNPYNEAELYRGVVRGYAPDLVLVQFCINDLNDPTLHFGAQTLDRLGALPDLAFPNPDARRTSEPDVPALAAACERSDLCALLLGRLMPGNRGPSDAESWRNGFEIREGPGFETEWSWLRARYADLAESVRRDGARFGVLAFPHEQEVGKPVGKPIDHDTDAGAASATATLVALGRQQGWYVIDLLPAFRRASTDGEDLFVDLWHPTGAGHRVAADAIARALRCTGELPGPVPPDCE